MGKNAQFPDPEAVAECEAEGEFARRIFDRTRAGKLQWVKVEDQDEFRAAHEGMWADWYTVLPGEVTVAIHLEFKQCYCGHRHCALVVLRRGNGFKIIGGTGVLKHTGIIQQLADLPLFALPPPLPPVPGLKISEVLEGL